jgi:hypothetical protein
VFPPPPPARNAGICPRGTCVCDERGRHSGPCRSVACLSARLNVRGRSSLDGSLSGVLWLPSFPHGPVIGGPGLAPGVLTRAFDAEWSGDSPGRVGVKFVQVRSCT